MIISISGLKGSGKDTLGSILISKYGFIKLSFASILKDIISILFDWDRKLLDGLTKESREWRETKDIWWSNKLKMNITPRFVMEYFGTDLFRNHFNNDIWVTALEKQLYKYKNKNIVITDTRFQNEIDMLKENGALFIKITRGKLPEWFEKYENCEIDKPEGIHPSEYSWIGNNFDFHIKNNNTIKELEILIDNFLRYL